MAVTTQGYRSPVDFTCPRCGSDADDDYYGPCVACRDQLRVAMRNDARDTGDEAGFEPKMNVTPNAVALKDD